MIYSSPSSSARAQLVTEDPFTYNLSWKDREALFFPKQREFTAPRAFALGKIILIDTEMEKMGPRSEVPYGHLVEDDR
jgi:hypothetical protein